MPLLKAQSIEYTKETQLTARLSTEIKNFWQHGLFASFNGLEQIRINYAAFTHAKDENAYLEAKQRVLAAIKIGSVKPNVQEIYEIFS